jgi:hypothetical protein
VVLAEEHHLRLTDLVRDIRLRKMRCRSRVTSSTLLDGHGRHTKPVLVTGNHPFVRIQALAAVPSELAKLTERGMDLRPRSRERDCRKDR